MLFEAASQLGLFPVNWLPFDLYHQLSLNSASPSPRGGVHLLRRLNFNFFVQGSTIQAYCFG